MGKNFEGVCRDIKSVKIQGARNIAKAALKAYKSNKTKSAKKKLLSLRPTEPMLANVLDRLDNGPYDKILNHFDNAQDKINKKVLKLIKNGDVIFTHCHSTNVVEALIHAKKKGKKFKVYNTETRPLYQGRKTARQLKNAKISVTMFPDSALGVALKKEQGTKKATKVLIGADALLKNGIINKIGSGTICRIAKQEKIPVYVIADSWKFSPKKLKLEQRSFKELWKKAPKGIKIRNPAFEFVPKSLIKKIITEK